MLALLQYQRDSLVRKAAGVDDSSARLSPVRSGTTLLWFIKHMAGAEITWLQSRFAGQPFVVPDDSVHPSDTLDAAIALYQFTWPQSDAIARQAASLDDVCRQPETLAQVNLRWVLAHLLEETARHSGHADIIRESLDGAKTMG